MQNELNLFPLAESLAQLDPTLDFTVASLVTLDCLLNCLRQGLIENQVSPDQMHWLIAGAGAYFAEVVRRATGAQWVNPGDQTEPWLTTPSGPLFPFQLVRRSIRDGLPGALALAAAEPGSQFSFDADAKEESG